MRITDEKLLRISLITALIGIIGLIIFTPSIEVKKIDIKDITRSMIDEKVSVRGIITDIKESSSKTNYFLTISDGESRITLIIFEKQVSEITSRNLDIGDFKNKKVEVVGTITEYKSDLELILSSGDSLRIIN
ncbi:OB-fold nucleic acid binding domain-containing protein [Methanobrevibacter gottschalkii]|uniref:OB-fold nucleic acid binding protein n=2 Tax=Methanobrevibacter gottschalkii TaxID=190974 RepID=A0A3N5BTH6_9EURY|nr:MULTISPECIES: exodeoxyribonuclease VII large subunit [Methanobrevibacter]MCQ2971381.1 exodeoxyribonuclease VII large subunit [archaeon]OEC97841.1 RNA-binding protein [Methanobrevibacter sp. A27]RPF53068.1 OB-fold nucleic acid binding protein [Methanobrevibacter gottschalkii DSM 11977]SEK56374.1 OB-fold nucleic acid binding domain-containing protein [Methanobrevibacter gottschalkii]